MRRDREDEAANNAQQQQQQQQPPAPDRVDTLFNALCGAFQEKFYPAPAADNNTPEQQQQKQQQQVMMMSKQEQKRLVRMFSGFLSGVNDPNGPAATTAAGDRGATAAAASSTHQSNANDDDRSLNLRFAAVDDILEHARTFLRGVMLKRLEQQQQQQQQNSAEGMLLAVAQSSSGTTAADDEAKKHKNQQQVTDTISTNTGGVFAVPTFEADSFLFDDEDIDGFEDRGWLSRNFCANCGHADSILKTSLISHSVPVASMKYICAAMFTRALSEQSRTHQQQKGNRRSSSSSSCNQEEEKEEEEKGGNTYTKKEFVAVDVGSRLGIVPLALSQWLHGTVWTSSPAASLPYSSVTVYGVEMSPEFCSIQRRLLACRAMKRKESYKAATGRVSVVESDVTAAAGVELLRRANFVVMNNVFEFFSNEQKTDDDAVAANADPEAPTGELRAWKTVLSAMPVGCHLVLVPSLEASLSAARKRAAGQRMEGATAAAATAASAEEAKPGWEARWQHVPIAACEMRRVAELCVPAEEEDDDDDDYDHNGTDSEVAKSSGGCCGGSVAAPGERVAELLEDFGEISLYVAQR